MVDEMTFVSDWASKKREAEKLAALEALISINKPPSRPKNLVNQETKDTCISFEKLDLAAEQQQNEPMECD
jgi:hypothetical protein